MPKWEYLRFRTVISSSLTVRSYMWIGPASKTNLKWVTQRFPSAKLEPDKDTFGQCVKIFVRRKEFSHLRYAIIEQLGVEGWEPFAAEKADLRFRRSQ